MAHKPPSATVPTWDEHVALMFRVTELEKLVRDLHSQHKNTRRADASAAAQRLKSALANREDRDWYQYWW